MATETGNLPVKDASSIIVAARKRRGEVGRKTNTTSPFQSSPNVAMSRFTLRSCHSQSRPTFIKTPSASPSCLFSVVYLHKHILFTMHISNFFTVLSLIYALPLIIALALAKMLSNMVERGRKSHCYISI